MASGCRLFRRQDHFSEVTKANFDPESSVFSAQSTEVSSKVKHNFGKIQSSTNFDAIQRKP
jgi:hypothetical protein